MVVHAVPEQLEAPGAAAADASPVVPLFRSMRRLMNAIKLWNEHYAPRAAEAAAAGPAIAEAVASLPGGNAVLT